MRGGNLPVRIPERREERDDGRCPGRVGHLSDAGRVHEAEALPVRVRAEDELRVGLGGERLPEFAGEHEVEACAVLRPLERLHRKTDATGERGDVARLRRAVHVRLARVRVLRRLHRDRCARHQPGHGHVEAERRKRLVREQREQRRLRARGGRERFREVPRHRAGREETRPRRDRRSTRRAARRAPCRGACGPRSRSPRPTVARGSQARACRRSVPSRAARAAPAARAPRVPDP